MTLQKHHIEKVNAEYSRLGTVHTQVAARGRSGLVVNTSDSGSRGRGFESHPGRRVVSLSKTYLSPKSTGNTKEAMAPFQHN